MRSKYPQWRKPPQRRHIIRAPWAQNPAPARIYIQIKQSDKINFPKSALPTIHKNFPLTRQGISVSFYPIMAKIDLELVKVVLQRSELDAKKIAQIIEDITFESKAQEAEKEKEPQVKKQYVVVVSDPYGKFTDADYTGWVVQIPEDENPATALERIHLGSYDYNLTPKGRRMPLKTIAEACEFGSAKIFKEHKVWIKTKEPVLIVRTNNKIPRESKQE